MFASSVRNVTMLIQEWLQYGQTNVSSKFDPYFLFLRHLEEFRKSWYLVSHTCPSFTVNAKKCTTYRIWSCRTFIRHISSMFTMEKQDCLNSSIILCFNLVFLFHIYYWQIGVLLHLGYVWGYFAVCLGLKMWSHAIGSQK